MSIGQLLAGGSGAPATSPRPIQRPAGIAEAPQSPREGFLQGILSDPVKAAMWLQTAAGLLSSRGLGPSVGMGLGAAGRAAGGLAETANAMEAETRRRGASAGGGGGGGGGTAEGAGPRTPYEYFSSEEFRERRDYYMDLLADDPDAAGMPVEERVGRANILAAQEAGFGEGAQLYNGAQSPEDRALIAREFFNPNQATRSLEGLRVEQSTGGGQTPTQPPLAGGPAPTADATLPGADTAPVIPGFGGLTPPNIAAPVLPNVGMPMPAAPAGTPLSTEEERRRLLGIMGVNTDTIPRGN
jgi:hypothetical protein